MKLNLLLEAISDRPLIIKLLDTFITYEHHLDLFNINSEANGDETTITVKLLQPFKVCFNGETSEFGSTYIFKIVPNNNGFNVTRTIIITHNDETIETHNLRVINGVDFIKPSVINCLITYWLFNLQVDTLNFFGHVALNTNELQIRGKRDPSVFLKTFNCKQIDVDSLQEWKAKLGEDMLYYSNIFLDKNGSEFYIIYYLS